MRHGPTEWSETGQHTGRTDVPLTEAGRSVARSLRHALAGAPAKVICSPLARAVETAALAGLDVARFDDDLVEWDYGDAEGISTATMRETVPDWSVWSHPIVGGEALVDVAGRADRFIARVRAEGDDVLVVAHGQYLRILAARWCGLPADTGRHLELDTAAVSVLGWTREDPVIHAVERSGIGRRLARVVTTDRQPGVGAAPRPAVILTGGNRQSRDTRETPCRSSRDGSQPSRVRVRASVARVAVEPVRTGVPRRRSPTSTRPASPRP